MKDKLNKSIICITGGAGFIGINLIKLLLTYNVKKIYVIDDLSSGNEQFIPLDKRVIFRHCDISNGEKYKFIFPKQVDYVFHLAAHFANQNSVDYPISDAKTNIIGMLNTLDVIKELSIKKMIYTSSSCVYGNSPIMKESDYIYPVETPYAINKLTGEMYVKFFSEFYGIPLLSVRIFNTYGPYELSGKYRNVIPRFIHNALNGDDIIITGSGNETRDFTYVDDTAELLILMALSDECDGDVYNAGTGISTSIKHLVEVIIKLCNSKSKIIYKDKRDWDNINHRLSNIEKSKLTFGYESKIELEEGIKKTIQWRREFDESK